MSDGLPPQRGTVDVLPGSVLPALLKEPITKLQLVKYADASGDHNPIHTDDEAARRVGLDGVIAHGMLSMAFLGQYLCWLFGPDAVRRLSVRFHGMVRPSDRLICRGLVREMSAHDGRRRVLLDVWVENQQQARVTAGDAEVETS